MNQEQAKALLRTLGATFGGSIMGWFASKGWHLSPDDAKSLVAILQSPELLGLLASGLAAIWGLVSHTQANSVAVVAAMKSDPASPVKGVIVEQTQAGQALIAKVADIAKVSDGGAVVPAGTQAAASMSAR